jgi:hypothetical protein
MMKVLLLSVLVFAACSTQKTAEKSQETSAVDTTQLFVISPSSECEHLRSTLIGMVQERVPELMEIGVPYIKRISNGRGDLEYSLRCPMAGAEDSLIRNYYEVGAGYALDDSDLPVFWYRVFISKDMRNLLIGEYNAEILPLEAARTSAKWKQDWQGRR